MIQVYNNSKSSDGVLKISFCLIEACMYVWQGCCQLVCFIIITITITLQKSPLHYHYHYNLKIIPLITLPLSLKLP